MGHSQEVRRACVMPLVIKSRASAVMFWSRLFNARIVLCSLTTRGELQEQAV